MGSIFAKNVKWAILRLQPEGKSLIEPITIEKLETFDIPYKTLADELNTVFGIDIPDAEAEYWETVGDAIASVEKRAREATRPLSGSVPLEEVSKRFAAGGAIDPNKPLPLVGEIPSEQPAPPAFATAAAKADSIIEHRLRMSDPEYFDFGNLRAGDAVKRAIADRPRLIAKFMKGEW